MADKITEAKAFKIAIDSIFGGHSHSKFFAKRDEFQTSYGIDPGLSADGGFDKASGYLVPSPASRIFQATNSSVLWMVKSPKESTTVYLYDAIGSSYTMAGAAVSGISDGGNESGTGAGNGAAYYDNYIYFARNTTIARYGPLDGTPTLNGDYWGTTLGKTALSFTSYPYGPYSPQRVGLPNHFLHRHSDGRLYIADVVNNQGYLHYIATTKTTVEGDTDNGSTYQKLPFGYGLWPTAIESYGSSLVIALCETPGDSGGGVGRTGRISKAKVAFWDTNSQNFNQISWVEFPDAIISSIKNIGGVLYFSSYSDYLNPGCRITRYVGGSTFQEVRYFDDISAPWPGAVAAAGERYMFGSSNVFRDGVISGPAIFSLGLQNQELSRGLFCIQRGSSVGAGVTSILLDHPTATFSNEVPIFAESGLFNIVYFTANGGGTRGAIDSGDLLPPLWRSQVYKMGQPFKITKIRLNLPAGIPANASITVKIYADQSATSSVSPKTVGTINTSTYSATTKSVVLRPTNATGIFDFFIEIGWYGSTAATSPLTVGLPIAIEGEYIDD